MRARGWCLEVPYDPYGVVSRRSESARAHVDMRAVIRLQDVDLLELDGSVREGKLVVEPTGDEGAGDAIPRERTARDIQEAAGSVLCLANVVDLTELDRRGEDGLTQGWRGSAIR